MNQEESYALLLQDVDGFKEELNFVGYGKQLKPVTIVKGSLLVRLNPSVVNAVKKQYDYTVNFRVDGSGKNLRDGSTKNTEILSVDPDVLLFLSRCQRDILLGIKNPCNRLEVLGRLEWIESLRKEDEVHVTIATIPAPVRGIIRYIGGLPGEDGRKFGIELKERRGQGTHDGSFKSHEFFKCCKDCAVFVAMDKLTDGDTVKAAKVTPTSDTSASKALSRDKDGVPIRLGDYVMFYGKYNEELRGIVRWIGTNKSVQPDGTPIVGIEAETHLVLSDIPHNIKDRYIRDYFSSRKSKVFLPITFVHRDKNNSPVVGKEQPANDNSGVLQSSPQESDTVTAQSHSTKGASNTKTAQPPGMTRRNSETSQPPSMKRRDSDTTITAQPHSLTKKDEMSSKRKAQHGYEPVLDLIIPDSCNPHNLAVGSAVQYMGFDMYGVIKWIGNITGSHEVYAGVEMEDIVEGSGRNGELMGVKYFKCKPGKGKFAILSSLKPDKRNKEIPVEPNPYNLKVGSVVQYSDPVEYGVIKWIGHLPDEEGLYAGVEMDNPIDEPHDGIWTGIEIFKCREGTGTFVQLSGLKPGTRDTVGGNQPTSTAADSSHHKQTTNKPIAKAQYPHNLELESPVQFGDPPIYGVIKWIGTLPGYGEALQAGMHMENDEDKIHNGTYNGKQYFQGRGRFVELSLLELDRRISTKPVSKSNEDKVKLGDSDRPQEPKFTHNFKIGSKIKHYHRYGEIKWIGKLPGLSEEEYAGLEMEEEVTNPHDGVWCGKKIFDAQSGRGKLLPLSKLQPDDRCDQRPQSVQQPLHKFETGSTVQFNNPPQYGVIKWIGNLPGQDAVLAGVETEEYVDNPSDGKYKGVQYFYPQAGKGKFIQLSRLQPDERFLGPATQVNPLEKHKISIEGYVVPPTALVLAKHTGLPKGIQGQQNSCYLDATLYGMFAFSDAFDGLFLERKNGHTNQKIQEIIQYSIVNPLRVNSIVPQESVLELRSCLDEIQKAKGLTKDEKDPEEFLNILFKYVFGTESYLTIQRPNGKEGEFFVQLFLDPDANVMPDTESLLHKMFVEQKIVFDEYPTKLLLQVPRYGKQFKVFQKVIPKLELDVTAICNIEQPCLVCGNAGNIVCSECCGEKNVANGIEKPFFCDGCSVRWHSHGERERHKPWAKKCQDYATGTLQLLSVLCIETSHYVCFTRITGSGKDEWVFFDSMAERPDDEFNRPEVKSCTDILNEWVYGDKDIINTTERPPELARRFVKDVYLCIYIDKEGTMYT